MASPNDSLIFPVHFDMDKAVKNAEDVFKGKEKELNKMFTANINLKISPKSIENLEDVQKRLKEIRLQPVTPETRNAIRVLVKELEGLAKILERIDRLNAQRNRNAGAQSAASALAAQRDAKTAQINTKTANDDILAKKKQEQATIRVQKAEFDLQRAKERSTTTINAQTKAFHSQANMLNGLKQTMGAYVSLLGAKTLASNIREVTAEFELQKVALTAILQDKAKADMLFGQVVDLAVKSPFQIKEMVSFTKQLAAYRINTDDLYDTTRRLADVSSGLGVEMSRIILAYGQVSAASVLRGQEVRQFTEAGIPLIQLLAEKFEELNGKAVTTGEVFELISQRKVSFEMVKEVFEDMTNAGGIFYDMQAKQADTLFGVYSNLRDALDVAFNEIGQENLGLMKGLGETLTDLGENWRTLEAILTTLVGTYGAYRIAMAMATRETKSYTLAQALANIEDSKKIAKSPAMITAILGESKANRLASINTNMLALSKYKLATANNVLTRTFYRLTTAMLTNPYVALATGIAAIGVALYAFRDRAVTTEQRIESLNSKVADFVASGKRTKELVDSYESLSVVINKTDGQQKRLNGTISELARLYPEAVTKVDEYGNAIEIATGKVAGLTKAERELRGLFITKEIDESKQKIKEYNDEIKKINEELRTKTFKSTVKTNTGEIEKVFKISDEGLKNRLKRLTELRSNVDKLEQSISTANKEITGLDSEKVSEIFSGWRKVMIDSSMYDSKALEELAQFPEAMDDVAKEYKRATAEVKKYSDAMSKGDESQKEYLEDSYKTALNQQKAYKGILSTLGQLSLLEDKGSKKKDPRVIALEAELKLIEEVHSRYQEFTKSMSKSEAKSRIEDIYGNIKPTTLKFAFNEVELKDQYAKFIRTMRSLGMSDADIMKINLKMSDVDFDKFKKKLDAKIKKLGEDLEKQQKANNFFEKIIGSGMDAQIAASITMSLYGFDASDIRETMISQLEKGMGDIKLDLTPEGTIDFSKVLDKLESMDIADDLKKAYIDTAKALRDNDAETIESLYSNLGKYSEYERRRMDIVNKANDERKKIQSSAVAESQKGTLMTQVSKKESKDLATLEYDIFKESDLYATMFENLDKVSTASLDAIRSKLEAFRQSNIENLDPTQVRELTRSFEKVDEQFRSRNPFQALINGISEYRVKLKEAEEANKNIADINARLSGARADVSMAKEMSAVAKAKGQDSKVWDDSVASSEKLIKQLEEQLGIQLKITNESKRSKDALAEGALGVSDKLGGIDSSIGSFGETLDMLGVDMDSELGATFGDLQNVIGGAAEAAGGFGKVMKGDLSGIGDMIKGTGKQIQGFVGIFTGINRKVARANKEIAKQAEIIRNLTREYQNLEKAMNDVLGVDWAQNNVDQIHNLQAQMVATQKQLEAERSKGKKKDKEKIAEYEEQIKDLQDRIVERQKAFSEQLLGTNVGEAARSFASAWLDAYMSFENTTEAIQNRMRDMMKNMLIEAILGKVIQDYVGKMFEEVGDIWDRQVEFNRGVGEKMIESDKKWLEDNKDKWRPEKYNLLNTNAKREAELDANVYTDSMISALTKAGIYTEEKVSLNKDKLQQLLNGANSWAEGLNDFLLEAMEGIDISGIQDLSDSSLTGISKAVGSLSEETALVLAGAANSNLYYNVGQYNELVLIRELLTRWEISRGGIIDGAEGVTGSSSLIAVQNLALDELRKANISLEDIMKSNREIQEFFVSLTSPLGSRSGTRAINVNI